MKALAAFLVIFQVFGALQANPIGKNATEFNKADEVDSTWRLPKTIYPKSYQISLATRIHDQGDLDYTGSVIIFLDVHVPTNKIILHSKDLNIREILLFEGFTTVDGAIYSEDEARELLIIETRDDLQPGQDLMVLIEFSGQLRLEGVGFYRSEYKLNGETRYLATTQFEAAYARYAFPVFDGIYANSRRRPSGRPTGIG
jgi:aminopeptidase 2